MVAASGRIRVVDIGSSSKVAASCQIVINMGFTLFHKAKTEFFYRINIGPHTQR
jgi:hypothetical protein